MMFLSCINTISGARPNQAIQVSDGLSKRASPYFQLSSWKTQFASLSTHFDENTFISQVDFQATHPHPTSRSEHIGLLPDSEGVVINGGKGRGGCAGQNF